MIGAALATFITAMPSLAAELNLARQSVELVAPPFVHAHEQATSQRSKIIPASRRSARRPRTSGATEGECLDCRES
jgi:hypothetical protein